MTWVAVAVGGAAVIGAVSQQQAAGRAARAQEAAAETAVGEQRRQFDVTQEQLDPFREAGAAALQQQRALLGIAEDIPGRKRNFFSGATPGKTAEQQQQEAFAAFAESPGQKFLRDQQEKALLRNAATIGGLGGGNVRTALQQQAFGRAQTDFSNQFNRLAGLSGTGQTAATNIGQLGAQSAQNIGRLQQFGGQARASGILGQNQAFQQGLTGVVGGVAQGGFFNNQFNNQQSIQPQPAGQAQAGGRLGRI